jgi:hypothetical protein
VDVKFRKLTEPTAEIAEYFTQWENDSTLIPFIRPNKEHQALEARETVTTQDLEQRLEHHQVYLIYLEERLIGEMDYQVDPKQVYKKETGTAWIGIIIGEEIVRGKGKRNRSHPRLYLLARQNVARHPYGKIRIGKNAQGYSPTIIRSASDRH